MFIWLASYPKSGNTLLRSLLSAYFFSNDGQFSFDLIKNIKQFPNWPIFKKAGVDLGDDNEVIKNYIKVQETFCQKDTIQFLKTHSYLFNFYNKYPFTNLQNSLGVIYIVRDPRNVVTSISKFQNLSLEKSLKTLTEDISWGGNPKSLNLTDKTKVWIGNWSQNYQSWKSFKFQDRYLLIKYEDLISDKEKYFLIILKFIYKINNSKFILDKKKFNQVLETTSFEKMQQSEKQNGFFESKVDENTKKKIPFFNLGPKNDWKKLLDNNIKDKIEKTFEKEMIELNYL